MVNSKISFIIVIRFIDSFMIEQFLFSFSQPS